MTKIRKFIRLRCEIDIPLDEIAIADLSLGTYNLATIKTTMKQRIKILDAHVKHAKVEVEPDDA